MNCKLKQWKGLRIKKKMNFNTNWDTTTVYCPLPSYTCLKKLIKMAIKTTLYGQNLFHVFCIFSCCMSLNLPFFIGYPNPDVEIHKSYCLSKHGLNISGKFWLSIVKSWMISKDCHVLCNMKTKKQTKLIWLTL